MSEPLQRPPIASSHISVILFARALATDADASLQGWRHYLDTLNRDYEILLIRETRPETGPLQVPEATSRMRTLVYERTLGIRAAVNEAVSAARHPLVAFCECDRQFDPADLNVMLKTIDQVDLVVGYRTGGQAPPWRVMLDTLLRAASWVFIGVKLGPRVCWLGSEGWGRRWAARWLFGLRVLDPECPFRLMRRDIFQHLPIQSGGPFVHVEILAKANHLSCLMAEEPVTWKPPPEPTTDAISFGDDAWVVLRNPDFGPYVAPAETAEAPPPVS